MIITGHPTQNLDGRVAGLYSVRCYVPGEAGRILEAQSDLPEIPNLNLHVPELAMELQICVLSLPWQDCRARGQAAAACSLTSLGI